ncbi:GntR family transcriptional regulator, transcriptional repressor for pyruvate dehydrogenase complex [Dethiosulfatibacter aminovorans DSM 17477]|uniref:GntR family transcriptional regulator, transcriptional repressor for pyruvate dehydrogenase complex n=1 Tax=Dethiosulfatibacter aminovorans DSM 17477 TaxID=1121476 RepID=A0A1M6KNQ9_9FIRM|nr:FadR/GntR family transcriptional regulator [Dethiosulfatibacter aminovorans]SHJ60579.1 GntR family transcriptional regulator, transcriptional repressor for pyruvate dehydrogenase complex [Dethiosulfatibacter aminovorans DSM 17477]
MFQSVENKKVSQVIIEQIQNMIMSGELKIGDKLPPERELTEMLKVGRPALREALKALEVIGVIERIHGQGNFISSNIVDSFFKPLSLTFKLSNGRPEEILQVRFLLETFTVDQAAKNATAEDIEKLELIHKRMMMSETLEDKAKYDKEFHFELTRISNNTLILNLYQSVSYLIDSFINETVRISLFEEKSIEKIYEEHEIIIQAIKDKDSTKAVEAVKRHLDNVNMASIKKLK